MALVFPNGRCCPSRLDENGCHEPPDSVKRNTRVEFSTSRLEVILVLELQQDPLFFSRALQGPVEVLKFQGFHVHGNTVKPQHSLYNMSCITSQHICA
jgi:hypothetical protein